MLYKIPTQGSNLLSFFFSEMWHKAIWIWYPMRLKLTHNGLLGYFAIHYSTQHYKVRIKGSGAILGMELRLPLNLSVVAIEKGAFESPLTKVANLLISYVALNIFALLQMCYPNVNCVIF